MTDDTKRLIQFICDGDIKRSQQQARIVVNADSTAKDRQFREMMIRKLDSKASNLIELPPNLKELLIAEDMTNFPMSRFLLREDESKVVDKMLSISKASDRLSELGISFSPALMLYGQSGGGKTMLARYIAHKADRPFVYVRFSNLVSSYLGSTQSNIARVFDYARTAPCVLCFDEIDAVGMARGQKNDHGELNRVVIAMMQEMDRVPNNVIIVGTTNRFDRLDTALIRRFPVKHEIMPMTFSQTKALAAQFFRYSGIDPSEWIDKWCDLNFMENEPASTVVEKCTSFIVEKILKETE